MTETRLSVRGTSRGTEFGVKVVPRAEKPAVDGLFELVAGETSRQKTLRVVGLPVDEVTRRLEASLEDA